MTTAGPLRRVLILLENEPYPHDRRVRQEALALHDRFKRGEISQALYERLHQDIGKEPDDLTRYLEGRA